MSVSPIFSGIFQLARIDKYVQTIAVLWLNHENAQLVTQMFGVIFAKTLLLNLGKILLLLFHWLCAIWPFDAIRSRWCLFLVFYSIGR